MLMMNAGGVQNQIDLVGGTTSMQRKESEYGQSIDFAEGTPGQRTLVGCFVPASGLSPIQELARLLELFDWEQPDSPI
ncbi:MAG: hypothetical protein AMXMBFR13_51640 [Phycisphaerae bacterium]